MKIKSQKDFYSGLMFLGIGLAFAGGATTYQVGTGARMGSGYFPLVLGSLLALIGAGVFSILLVAARTPGVNQWLPAVDFFRVALVVHVDLSVLVWFAAMAAMLWTLIATPRAESWSWLALGLCSAGALLMSVGAFVSPGAPIMANYIPVLEGALFMAGLAAFAAGFALHVLRALLAAPRLSGASAGRSPCCRARSRAARTTRSCSGAAATRCSSPGRC